MLKRAANYLRTFRAVLQAALASIHPVDRSLMLFMVVLLGQSIYSLFSPGNSSHLANEIDVIVRTSAAAIFGYFLSANFASCTGQGGTAPSAQPVHTLNTTDSGGVSARIGFAPDTPELSSGGTEIQPRPTPASGCIQTTAAAILGLFCLVALVVLRNTAGDGGALSDSATATVVQFRDFISGCVGYLIGSPTHMSANSSS